MSDRERFIAYIDRRAAERANGGHLQLSGVGQQRPGRSRRVIDLTPPASPWDGRPLHRQATGDPWMRQWIGSNVAFANIASLTALPSPSAARQPRSPTSCHPTVSGAECLASAPAEVSRTARGSMLIRRGGPPMSSHRRPTTRALASSTVCAPLPRCACSWCMSRAPRSPEPGRRVGSSVT
jgi:hypothetical protein